MNGAIAAGLAAGVIATLVMDVLNVIAARAGLAGSIAAIPG